jgi:hypothetical protein
MRKPKMKDWNMIQVGFIGVGYIGSIHLGAPARMGGVEVRSVEAEKKTPHRHDRRGAVGCQVAGTDQISL